MVEALASMAAEMEPDALRVLHMIATRLVHGRKQYGPLDIATDRRRGKWLTESLEESLDRVVYETIDTIERIDARSKPDWTPPADPNGFGFRYSAAGKRDLKALTKRVDPSVKEALRPKRRTRAR